MDGYDFKKAILACGAESKGVFSLAKGRNLFISKDFGYLGDYHNFSRYKRDIKKNISTLDIKPKLIACDMHPEYSSTIFAEEFIGRAGRIERVQHHHAHIASCMAENRLKGKVIGVAFDGTGYGMDGAIWGGEFLVSTLKDFKRAAHLEYIPMPGGDMAVSEPWRMAVAYLYHTFGGDLHKINIPFTKSVEKKEWQMLKYLIDRGINAPLTSSMGRFFDAVAAILFSISKVDREAEAAVKLQGSAEAVSREEGTYKYKIKKDDALIIDTREVIKGIVKDIKAREERPKIASRFHNTVAAMVVDVSRRLRSFERTASVVLSGGVFQNKLLTEKVRDGLIVEGFDVYTHNILPATDAGISVGQAVIADMRNKKCV